MEIVYAELIGLLLLSDLTASTHSLTNIASAGAGVTLGALPSNRQASHMAHSSVGLDILQALNIGSYFSLEIALEGNGLDDGADFILLINGSLFALGLIRNTGILENLLSAGTANTVQRC